jgi:hypothetical protein
MNPMRMRQKAWWRKLRILVLPACALALAVPAGAPAAAQQDLRSPDARDAARAAAPARAPADLGTPAPPTIVESTDSGDQALPIVLASAALGIALAGLVVALGALFRRPRTRWTVS